MTAGKKGEGKRKDGAEREDNRGVRDDAGGGGGCGQGGWWASNDEASSRPIGKRRTVRVVRKVAENDDLAEQTLSVDGGELFGGVLDDLDGHTRAHLHLEAIARQRKRLVDAAVTTRNEEADRSK